MSSISSTSSSLSREYPSLPLPPRYPTQRVLRTAGFVDELDALGFTGVPRRRASNMSSSTTSLSSQAPPRFDPPPPPYCRFDSVEHHDLGFAGVDWGFDEPATLDDIITISYGDVIKAKLRYKLHKLRMGKKADEWHVFLNKSLKPGEAPWAPLGSMLWKVRRSRLSLSYTESESSSVISTERRSSL